jgi:hypothetical protein
VKIITGTSGRINELLKGVPNEEFISAAPFGDGKVLIVVKGEVAKAGEVVEIIKEVEIEVIKEVIKNVPFDNPELLDQIQTLQDALSDALNAEEAAKKEAEDLKISLKTLKTKFTKLKNKFLEEED